SDHRDRCAAEAASGHAQRGVIALEAQHLGTVNATEPAAEQNPGDPVGSDADRVEQLVDLDPQRSLDDDGLLVTAQDGEQCGAGRGAGTDLTEGSRSVDVDPSRV